MKTIILLLLLSLPCYGQVGRTTYTDFTKDANCVGAWRFNKDLHTTVLDTSGNDNHGEANGTPSYIGGKEGNCWSYNTAPFFEIPDDATLDFGAATDFSVVAWIKTDSGARVDIINKGTGQGADTHWEMYIGEYGNGQLSFFIDDGSNVKASNDNGTDVTDDVWRHVAITFDRDGNAIRYVDGEHDGTDAAISAVGNINNNKALNIGTRGDDNNPFNGEIDELAIFNDILTAQEIKEIYTYGLK